MNYEAVNSQFIFIICRFYGILLFRDFKIRRSALYFMLILYQLNTNMEMRRAMMKIKTKVMTLIMRIL